MATIFISYAHDDVDKAKALATALGALGHNIWWDDQLRAGEQFLEMIEKHLSKVEAVIVIWTETSIGKPWVIGEATLAQGRGVLVPVRFAKDVCPVGPLGDVHMEYFGDWNGARNAPEIDRLNERIGQLKTASDVEKVAALMPPMLRQTLQDSNSLRVLLDTALPGGLRVYRFVLGSVVTSGIIWLGLSLLHAGVDDIVIGPKIYLKILGLIGAARICNQLIIASRRQYVDRFFDPSFAFLCLTSLLLGALFSIGSRLFWPLDLVTLIDQAVAISLYTLISLYGLRVFLLAVSILQRRVA